MDKNQDHKMTHDLPFAFIIDWPALGLGQLGPCLGPLTREAPNLGANFFIFYINIFLKILKHFSFYFFPIKKAQVMLKI